MGDTSVQAVYGGALVHLFVRDVKDSGLHIIAAMYNGALVYQFARELQNTKGYNITSR